MIAIIVSYLRLLNFGIFHRAAKEERKKKDDKAKTKKVKDSEVKEEVRLLLSTTYSLCSQIRPRIIM